ncbi:MAG: glycerophosphodiester phosphodiesterase family protein [Acutalibacteraceae bacterium]|nr:glycerophosphodiester phosphodiesterase family protein [Acutalibacteraceae bacterium]
MHSQSFLTCIAAYIDNNYEGKINRAANPFEIVDLYGCYTRNDDLSNEKIKFVALQMPYYWDDGKLMVANLGKTGFMDYAHKYGISVQYWTVNKAEDAQALSQSGADLLMTDYPDRIRDALYDK